VSNNWSRLVSDDEANRRAAGRRHYNSLRQFHAAHRRHRVLQLLQEYGIDHGVRARIAAELGVHRSTISRDFAFLFTLWFPCPACGTMLRKFTHHGNGKSRW
jgi:hypothetical protein